METRLNGTSDAYVEQDSQSVDTGKGNTAVLTATGLTAATKYDYRIKVDGIVFTTSLTVTMPEAGGRFIIYVVADGHGDSVIDTVFEEVLNDYISSYDPLPALILYHGDLIDTSSPSTIATRVLLAKGELERTNVAAAIKRIPMIYMWDDWDFGGNNSCYGRYPSCSPADETAILTAGTAKQFAGPLPGAGRPAFSYLVLGALRGWGDADGDGKVTASEAVEYANEALRATLQGRQQTPEVNPSVGGSTVLASIARPNAESGPNLSDVVLEMSGGTSARETAPMVEAPAPPVVVAKAERAPLGKRPPSEDLPAVEGTPNRARADKQADLCAQFIGEGDRPDGCGPV